MTPAACPQPVGTIWHMPPTQAPWLVEPRVPATFSPLGPEAAEPLARAMSLTSAEVRLRFEGGQRCYAAWVQGGLAAYGWISFQEASVGGLGLRLKFQPGEAYIWDCVTLPSFQRQGLYTALLGRIVAALRSEGVRQVWIGADYENHPSHLGINRAGFIAVADLMADPPEPGQSRRRAWLQARPGISPDTVAEARRAYMEDCEEVWLFE